MIRDFSLVFLLLISDRRNLHRDSRRDTEQNVPCATTEEIPPIRDSDINNYFIYHKNPTLARLALGLEFV